MHLTRASMRSVARRHWPAVAGRLKAIYHATSAEEAAAILDELEADWGQRYPGSDRYVAPVMGCVHPVPGLADADPETDLHLEHGRVAQRQVPINNQTPWPFPRYQISA